MKSVKGIGNGKNNKTDNNILTIAFNCKICFLVDIVPLGFDIFSTYPNTFSRISKSFSTVLLFISYFPMKFGMYSGLLRRKDISRRIIRIPKGVLLPGIDAGIKNGANNIIIKNCIPSVDIKSINCFEGRFDL